MPDYRLICANTSRMHGNFSIYQMPPQTESIQQVVSLAWLSRPAPPSSSVTFTWSTAMSFVWGERGRFRGRSYFAACQQVPAHPERENLIDLTSEELGSPFFANLRGGGPSGALTVRQRNAIFNYPVHVGIAIGGSAVYTVEFQANISTSFIAHRDRYWVTFGGYSPGEAIDATSVTNGVVLDFSPINPTLSVVMGPDNILRHGPA
ncbi:hypothetical protein [Rhizobium straminoryzae]|uniref:Uncharacterized protein n=1 Tax=Rhizobium straminoryzae TaxID=1387186 RepID=A0A549T6H4_9HYPH|nr:hypothetical protein [Rhizobium straminoryzae]TRL37446.1 hypothetical protein FNA46_15165 [Rhizobium straminoryzae]